MRFITCGSVDDGKSTMIGRLLFESNAIFEDQLRALTEDSKRHGTQGERLDFALLVDGMHAEREQGITIDVAYRFFSTPRRKFIVADAPGHEQYTRNMATGASTAGLGIVLVDARKGVLVQTRRHTRILALLGVRSVVLAINKMDLVAFDESRASEIGADYKAFAGECGIGTVTTIPMSALEGDNLIRRSDRMPWYRGPSLLEYLETVEADSGDDGPFRMPVQWINRPNADFRGVCGRIAKGSVRPGDAVRVLPAGTLTTVARIAAYEGDRAEAAAGDSTTLVMADDVDISRGDVIAAASQPPETADQFQAHLIWMSQHALIPGRQYILKIQSKQLAATVTAIRWRIDVNTGAHLAAPTLALNEIGVVNVSLAQHVAFEPYRTSRSLGGFVLIDKLTYETAGAGLIDHALRRSANIHWQALDVNKDARAALKHQTPRCVWLTGLPGSGKSTIANRLEQRLHALGRHTYVLDGDNIRHGLSRDLGFTEAARAENVRRVAEVGRLMVDAGLVVIVAFISPYRAERSMARGLFVPGEFLEVFVDTPLDECERRDPKGLYAKARRGELLNFTGIDSDYEPPEAPEVHVRPAEESAEQCVERILARLE